MEVKEVDAKYLIEQPGVSNEALPIQGYKQTEVGVIPSDWGVRKLRHISPSQSVGLVINPSSYFVADGTIPMLVGSHVSENCIKWTKANLISQESNQRLPASRLYAGDLVTVRVGEPGVTAVVPPELHESNCASMMIVRQHSSFDSHWLCYLMNSRVGRSQIENVQYGTAQKQFNISDAIDFIFPTPTREEQTAIANALSDVDALINSLENLIAKKQAIKTATMQQLLTGRTRLPQFATHPDGRPKGTKQSELGEIPEDWEVVKLGEVMERVIGGGTPSRSNASYWGNDIPWVTVKDFATFNPLFSQEAITADGLKNSASNLIPKGTLITSTRMALGKAVIYEVDVAINQDLKAIFPNAKLRTHYLYYWFAANELLIDELGSGSTVKGLSLPDLKAIAILLPLVDEQSSISAVLSDIDKEVESLSHRLEKTRQIKQGMMQELLTGRTRLVKPQQTAEVKKAANHNWQFNEAVVISVLADKFASHKFPLGRMRYTKLSYLLHRHWEGHAEGYKKKAAGPYNPKTRYGGPEKIAINNGYVTKIQSGKYMGYCSGENITKAVEYFDQWYGMDVVNWLEQFRYQKNDQLELLTTVDMAMVELRSKNREVSVQNVKALIENTPDWKPKLKRAIFSDTNIARAIEAAIQHFGEQTISCE